MGDDSDGGSSTFWSISVSSLFCVASMTLDSGSSCSSSSSPSTPSTTSGSSGRGAKGSSTSPSSSLKCWRSMSTNRHTADYAHLNLFCLDPFVDFERRRGTRRYTRHYPDFFPTRNRLHELPSGSFSSGSTHTDSSSSSHKRMCLRLNEF